MSYIPNNEKTELIYKLGDNLERIAKVNINNALNVSVTSESGGSIETTPFNEFSVAEKTTVIELKSIYGISNIRDKIITIGTGTVTNDIGDREYTVRITGGTSLSKLESVERGRYVSGKSSEYGLGVRLSSSGYTGDTIAKWGAINNTNGMYFGQDSGGTFVAILDNSNEEKIYQSSWNVDKMDGTGTSGLILNTTDGQVFNIQFTWYGYGVIDFIVYKKTIGGLKKNIVHRYIIDGKTSLGNPNLPLCASIEQTSTTNNEIIFVGGRQYSILGTYEPSYRSSSEIVTNKTVPNTNLIPIINFRVKNNYNVINSKIEGFEIISDVKVLVEIYIGTTLTGASFSDLTRKVPTETAFESDTTATNFSDGDLLYRTIAVGGIGNSKSIGSEDLRDLILEIPENLIATLAVQSLDVGDAKIDCVFRLREEW